YRLILFLILYAMPIGVFAQQANQNLDQQLNQSLRGGDKMIVVIAVLVVIFLLITTYLIYQDLRLKKIEKAIHQNKTLK
ncbi:MAG: CcmD family protein, partial [Bacteroidota bacterium]